MPPCFAVSVTPVFTAAFATAFAAAFVVADASSFVARRVAALAAMTVAALAATSVAALATALATALAAAPAAPFRRDAASTTVMGAALAFMISAPTAAPAAFGVLVGHADQTLLDIGFDCPDIQSLLLDLLQKIQGDRTLECIFELVKNIHGDGSRLSGLSGCRCRFRGLEHHVDYRLNCSSVNPSGSFGEKSYYLFRYFFSCLLGVDLLCRCTFWSRRLLELFDQIVCQRFSQLVDILFGQRGLWEHLRRLFLGSGEFCLQVSYLLVFRVQKGLVHRRKDRRRVWIPHAPGRGR